MLGGLLTNKPEELKLTTREQQVLTKICSGRTVKKIAYDLNLSAHTVRYYHRNVMTKFDVNRTADLIVYAMKHGLISG
jgi:two-component system, NarL family, invasion response regulator UvrY